MGNSQRRERRHEGRIHRRDRTRPNEATTTSESAASSANSAGARQRSSTQPTNRPQRAERSRERNAASGNHSRPIAVPQWVTPNYHAAPQVGAEVQESKSIKNHANLNKLSLALVPARDGRFRIRFRADCRVEADVCIYLATRETPNADNAGVRFEPQHPRFANAVLPTQKLPAETDCTYTSPSINVRNYWKYLKYRPHQPHDYPIVISISYAVADAEWEAFKSKTKEEEKKEEEGKSVVTEKRVQSQFTYAEVVRTAHEDKPTEYSLKLLKQRLQIGNELYDLEDIYGMPTDTAPAESSSSTNEPVTASLAGVADHEEGEECVICLAEPRNTLVMPCRHMCLCSGCATMLRERTNKCPICRTVAERFLTFKKEKDDKDGKADSDSDGEVDFNKTPEAVAAAGSKLRSASAGPTQASSSIISSSSQSHIREPHSGPASRVAQPSPSAPQTQAPLRRVDSRSSNRPIEHY